MSRADGNLFLLLSDAVSRKLLRRLLGADAPLTQRELIADTGLSSSTVSRRMGGLEDAGLVTRRSAHAPYELLFPSQTRQLLIAAADLAHHALDRLADEAGSHARELRKESYADGNLRDRARGRA